MAGRGRGAGGRGRGRGMPAFMNKETKDLLSTHGIGRVDNVPPPVYDVIYFYNIKIFFFFFRVSSFVCRTKTLSNVLLIIHLVYLFT